MNIFDGKHVLITGGTGSLGKTLVTRLLSGGVGEPDRIVVFSRDEAKQHQMRVDFEHRGSQTDEIVYQNFRRRLQFRIGDVRDFNSISLALQGIDIVINAAAMKQVPTCEYFPFEAVQTNIGGANNIISAISRYRLPVETLVGISTDKAVMPINSMGMTKALQERLLISAQINLPDTKIVIVRYGNVMASRGSVIPLFHHQILNGGPVTITDNRMTRFLFTLSAAVDTIIAAIGGGRRGEIYVPMIPSGRITDIARALVGDRKIAIEVTGIRPGEKIHEILIAPDESARVEQRGAYYCVAPMLPELAMDVSVASEELWEYSSGASPVGYDEIYKLLEHHGLRDLSATSRGEEVL